MTGGLAVLYPARLGRPSIAPARLLRALLLQASSGIRLERQLKERMEFDLLFRWFLRLRGGRAELAPFELLEEPGPAAAGRDRGEVPAGGGAPAEGETASVERPLLCGRDTAGSVGVDQELPAKDCGDNNASGGGCASLATGTAEREEALARIDARRGKRRITLGADKAYDMAGFVALLRSRSVSPHIVIDGYLSRTGKPRRTAVDRRVMRHIGCDISQR